MTEAARAILRPFDRREAVSLKDAAYRAGVNAETMRRWCAAAGIGAKIGSTWRVSKVALGMYLDRDFAALRLYLSGDRQSDIVGEYFERENLIGVLHWMRGLQKIPQDAQTPRADIAIPARRAHVD